MLPPGTKLQRMKHLGKNKRALEKVSRFCMSIWFASLQGRGLIHSRAYTYLEIHDGIRWRPWGSWPSVGQHGIRDNVLLATGASDFEVAEDGRRLSPYGAGRYLFDQDVDDAFAKQVTTQTEVDQYVLKLLEPRDGHSARDTQWSSRVWLLQPRDQMLKLYICIYIYI